MGAPSTYLKNFTGVLCQKVKKQLAGYPPEVSYWPVGVSAVKKVEKVELKDGTTYSLTSTWIPEPEEEVTAGPKKNF